MQEHNRKHYYTIVGLYIIIDYVLTKFICNQQPIGLNCFIAASQIFMPSMISTYQFHLLQNCLFRTLANAEAQNC